ncbi:hypothetical protein DQ392_00975 [Streptomyces reniochalinae]|uniref:Uncharacterized protein n=1 Tax=Streptomyces reniochalinae TaxID=2250578 RepID=A0A367F4C0_9ACTN|nr:hypothetical protein DQ392_00975 [Streptomyces reniochalinae]
MGDTGAPGFRFGVRLDNGRPVVTVTRGRVTAVRTRRYPVTYAGHGLTHRQQIGAEREFDS